MGWLHDVMGRVEEVTTMPILVETSTVTERSAQNAAYIVAAESVYKSCRTALFCI